MSTPLHTWRFFSAGGFDQVRLDTGADLLHLDQLDQKLWVALSCPTKGIELAPQTLALIDSDADGHIRAPELIGAIQWAAARLKSPDTLVAGGPLALADLDDSQAEGQHLLASAQHLLSSLGKADATTLSAEDCADSARILASMPFNGDGVITATGQDEALQTAIGFMVTHLGGVPDRSGETGVDLPIVERFFAEATALSAWRQAPHTDPTQLPLGPATADACAALVAVRAKVNDYFTRCQLATFDPRASEWLNGSEDQLRTLGSQLLATGGTDMTALPLAYIQPNTALPLTQGLNPAWSEAIATLLTQVVTPLMGPRTTLTEADWATLQTHLAPYETWQATQPATALSALEPATLEALLATDVQAQLTELIARDAALASQAEALDDVNRLVLYTRDLAKLAHNFVAFTDFYTQRNKASFQAGTLYLDGRSCDLCVKVLDTAKHAALATLSGIYLAYCECSRPGEKMTIAAAFTAGDADQLMVGRNGLFYDRQGRDWDATITKIVEHPISIRQAFWAPYKKVVRLLAEQAQKLAAAKAKSADDLTTGAVTQASNKVAGAAPAAPTPFDAGKFAGIFAAVGLAVGAIGTALASVVTGLLGLKAWQIPLALIGLVLMVSGPSMALAFFKLRNRNLGPLLDANGWAVNTRARINIPFGTALTQTAQLPAGAERSLRDPYAEKPTPWGRWLLLGALMAGVWIYAIWGAGFVALLGK